MTVKTEGRHAAEFILSEANNTRSRDTATVASGQDLVAGQVVEFSGGNLIAASGDLESNGDITTAVAGIMFDNVDASDGSVSGAVYIARDAEVSEDNLTFPTESSAGGEKAAAIESLATLGIIVR